jgi:hypothetical protein
LIIFESGQTITDEVKMIKYTLKFSVLLIICLVFLFSCTENNLFKGDGVLEGKITIGPLCPVESIPPDPRCLPTAETYKAWATAVWTLNRKSKVATIDPKLDGTYDINIPSGSYIIDFAQSNFNHVGGSNLPYVINISFGNTTKFNINIDTGIR